MESAEAESAPGHVSLSPSDNSMDRYDDFKASGPALHQRKKMESAEAESAPGHVSLSPSDNSMDRYDDFKGSGPALHQREKMESAEAESAPGHVSLSPSDNSMDRYDDFKGSGPALHQRSSRSSDPTRQDQLDAVFLGLEKNILIFVKEQLQRFYRLLSSQYPESNSESEEEQRSREAALDITLDFLRRMNQEDLAEHLKNKMFLGDIQQKLKRRLQQSFSCVSEGVAKAGKSALLNHLYTELYITEGDASEVNQEHELTHIENFSRTAAASESTITCEDLFKGPAHRQRPTQAELTEKRPIRTVLTMGVTGVGKTVLTQKFSLDWAEGRVHQDVQLLFPFTFRELNVLKDRRFSLVELLHHFFSQTKGLCSFQQLQVLFIFDGLDECRLPLDFSRTRVLTEPTESASVEELLVNLIRGDLLPSARLWITTRPAAANQIPAECVSMVTEVRGFNDPQKELYFRKRFTDEQQATAVISHIKSIRSLYIMSRIPVFCWILSTVLQMETREGKELPHTLTQMYIHFLVVQAKVKGIKYDGRDKVDSPWTPETREMVKSLGKLAFEQLQKGKLIFYESDLSECGLDAAEIARYSGVFTQVFREERGLYQDKVYCFIHLSVQEFLAALHVHRTFVTTNVNLLEEQEKSFINVRLSKKRKQKPELSQLHQTAVDQALQSPNGHLDLFLRFLLGLSLPTNQSLLQGLLTQTGSDFQTQKTVEHIKEKIYGNLSLEKRINLFHCLTEVNDSSLLEHIQWTIHHGQLDKGGLSNTDWSAVIFLILSSVKELEVFDLKKYASSEEVLLRLLPVVKVSHKAILTVGLLSKRSCDPLSSVLGSQSNLRHLDLSNSRFQDTAMELLYSGLKSTTCRLATLSLSCCGLSPLSCAHLASVLSSSSLTDLDLSNNDLQDSGVERLCDGLKSATCRLEKLRLSGCLISNRGGASLASALSSAPSHLRELDLSYNHLGPSAERLTALRDQPHCPLVSLRLEPAGIERLFAGLSKYFCHLTLDTSNATESLQQSKENKVAKRTGQDQIHASVRQKFKSYPHILCFPSLTGRCYWEVDWEVDWDEDWHKEWNMDLEVHGRGGVDIAVCYRDSLEKKDSAFGLNDKSWCLRISEHGYTIRHNKKGSMVFALPSSTSGRVGVYLDSAAGSLSFYRIHQMYKDKKMHLYTFNATFQEPLYAGFGFRSPCSSVSLVDLKTE